MINKLIRDIVFLEQELEEAKQTIAEMRKFRYFIYEPFPEKDYQYCIDSLGKGYLFY